MAVDIELRHLRVFEVLLRERNLTRAAAGLAVSQPALSKTLAALRAYFADPLFIRVGHRMEPTAKALELEPSIRTLLDDVTELKAQHRPFDPKTSSRTFNFSVADAGIVRLLPPLIRKLAETAPRVSLKVWQIDIDRLESALESGRLDFAMGSFASLGKRIRRQHMWSVDYVSIARNDHPRLPAKPNLKAFLAEKHIFVSADGTGHAHQVAQRALEEAIPAEQIICHVPSFVTAAILAGQTDNLVTVPLSMASELAGTLKLRIFTPPVKLPKIDVAQYWHERFHREPGIHWIRNLFAALFVEPKI